MEATPSNKDDMWFRGLKLYFLSRICIFVQNRLSQSMTNLKFQSTSIGVQAASLHEALSCGPLGHTDIIRKFFRDTVAFHRCSLAYGRQRYRTLEK